MDINVTLILILACCIPSSYTLRLFHYVNLTMTWANAQQYCRAKYTDLATIKSMADISKLNRPTLVTSVAWIGLNDDPNSWKGVMAHDSNSWRWSATGATSSTGYQSWSSGEPNDEYIEYCVMMYSSGFWNDATCDSLSGFVCYTGTTQNVKTYVYLPLQFNWTDARNYCRKYYTDLPTIENSADNTNVHNAMSSYPNAWIGLYRVAWKWSDKSTRLFRNWEAGQPDNYGLDQYCVTEDDQHQWNDDVCETPYAFICQEDLKEYMTVVKIKIQTSADMTDPVTNTEFFQKLGAVLRSQERPYIELRWKTGHR